MRPIDRLLLGLSYLLLVTVVIGGGYWIHGQLADAHEERCYLGRLQVSLSRDEVLASPGDQAALLADLDRLAGLVAQECPDVPG